MEEFVRAGQLTHPDRHAVRCDGHTQTYAQLYERSCRLANALSDTGIERGDRVATLGNNRLQSIEQLAGIAIGGYVRCSLYTHNAPEANLDLLRLVGATALIVDGEQYEALEPLLHDAHTLRRVIVLDDQSWNDTLNYEESLAGASSVDPNIQLKPDEPHVIRFSAGTTGKSKGILHTVAGWTGIGSELTLALPPHDENDRYLASGPLAHGAIAPVWPVLAGGGCVVVMPAFDPVKFLELVETERCTTTYMVPTMIQMIVGAPGAGEADLSSLRAIIYGAAPVTEDTLEKATALWGPIMYQVYGQSEVIPLTVLPPEDHLTDDTSPKRRLLRSAGRATPNSVVRILGPDGDELPPGEVGEIAGRSPGAMAAVWGNPQASAERIRSDGLILTRDMGWLDEDGYLFLADRKEDMIISGGFNIWPAELENALASHPAVAEVAVIGVPHPKWGESPKAVVVLRDGEKAEVEDLIEWSRAKVGAVKRVTSVEFVAELPKTPIGKVLRRAVRAMLADNNGHPAERCDPSVAGRFEN